GHVLHHGLAATDDPVDQGRLADVGAPHDRDGGQHLRPVDLDPELVGPLLGDGVPVGVVVPGVLDDLLGGARRQVELRVLVVVRHAVFPSAVSPTGGAMLSPSASATRWSRTSSRERSEVSTTTASAAGRSGLAARVESLRSRSITAASTSS